MKRALPTENTEGHEKKIIDFRFPTSDFHAFLCIPWAIS